MQRSTTKRCPICLGRGTKDGHTCPNCNGAGDVADASAAPPTSAHKR
ncbi:MAG TPA: hypothetical protein VM056_02595 [Terriglobales bacterium]|nr:hypothetical protein [Terriglobales bacterium]